MAQKKIAFQDCKKCGRTYAIADFLPTKSFFAPDGYCPICNDCLMGLFAGVEEEGIWDRADKICQLLDVPFIPARWQKMWEESGPRAIIPYCKIFQNADYDGIGWSDYQKKYEEVRADGSLAEEIIPGMAEQKLAELREKWGSNYDEEELRYLERLFTGVKNTQNINGDLQYDQALKLCKISLTIDSRIREGGDIDKLLGSYEKLVKIGDFTPRNVKNAEDFDSVGELFSYLEKTGFVNKFYDGVNRDIVDITMNDIQNFCQRLYTQEPGIGEEIEKRIESLKTAQEIEDNMGLLDNYTGDDMDVQIDQIIESEDFDPEVMKDD